MHSSVTFLEEFVSSHSATVQSELTMSLPAMILRLTLLVPLRQLNTASR